MNRNESLTDEEIHALLCEILRRIEALPASDMASATSGLCCDLASALRGDVLAARHLRQIAIPSAEETRQQKALRFLKELGIVTPTGRLSKRYGG